MKPAPFEYEAPRSLDEALALLAEHGDDAKVLAGGQSLVPLLNFRLARPALLVDVNGLDELAYARREDGVLRIGALTRQADLEASPDAGPLFVEALAHVGHPQIRNRGTVGGSCAHADPAAELPVALAALGATFHVESAHGARSLAWDDFFVSHLTTALEPDELLVEIEAPAAPAGAGTAFVELARRHGDFALGGAAAIVTLAGDGTCERAALVLLGAGPRPLRAAEAEAALAGRPLDEDAAREAAALAVRGAEPPGDLHGSAGYRRRVLETLARRALLNAAARAQ